MSLRERWEARKTQAVIGAIQPRSRPQPLLKSDAERSQEQADFRLGLKIGGGVLAGVALAHLINGAASGPAGWALASWANQNGVQL